MKTKSIFSQSGIVLLLLAFAGSSMSCMTTYDSYGRPVQSVDPGVAVAGAAAAGVLGYAIANDRDDRRHRHYHRSPRHYGRY